MHEEEAGRIGGLTVTGNVWYERGGSIGCKAITQTADLDVDPMIFAIGDVADPSGGLPYNRDAYITNPVTMDPKGASYELFDPQSSRALDGRYAVGWAGKASDGQVGNARHV